MSLITWDDSYLTGIATIDLQHQELLNILNNTFESLGKLSQDDIMLIVIKLENYTNYHFNTEEKLMEAAHCANIDFHKKEHEYFVEKIKEFKKLVLENKTDIAKEIVSFLTSWFITHIKTTDIEAGKCITDKKFLQE